MMEKKPRLHQCLVIRSVPRSSRSGLGPIVDVFSSHFSHNDLCTNVTTNCRKGTT